MSINQIMILKFLIHFITIFICNCQNVRPIVTISQGTIIGVKIFPDSSQIAINAYLGVPYAESPTGKLRFAVPERHRGWNKTFYATNYQPVCPYQLNSFDVNGNEDCLYLNIWSPEDAYRQQFPVIVYMESERWTGYPNLIRISGYELASEGVIVVSVSFRQNIFGFFCLGIPDARGNLGLLDQYLALVWVKENIAHFGGNPNLITLMGHSTSAVSVLHHLVSPRTSGLFTRIIIMSESVTPSNNSIDPIGISNKVANDLGCAMSLPNATLDCLRTKPVKDILLQFNKHFQDNTWDKSVMPVVDTFLKERDRYLPQALYNTLRTRNFTAVPLLMGITDFLFKTEQWKWNELDQNYLQLLQYAEEYLIPLIIEQYGITGPYENAIKDLIRWKYMSSNENDAKSLAKQIHDLEWEAQIAAPHDYQLTLLSKSSAPVFTYILHQYNTLSNVSAMSGISGDLLLLFGQVLLQQLTRRRFNVAEASLSQHLKKLWITFAREGHPMPSGYDMWQSYSETNKYVRYFGDRVWDSMHYEKSTNFWNKLLPKLASNTYTIDTIPKELQSSPDPAAGFRHAMYTLVGLVVALLTLLLICVVLLKKRSKERTNHMGF